MYNIRHTSSTQQQNLTAWNEVSRPAVETSALTDDNHDCDDDAGEFRRTFWRQRPLNFCNTQASQRLSALKTAEPQGHLTRSRSPRNDNE